MPENDEDRRARRLDDAINRLRKGEPPRIKTEDAADAPAIRAASRLAGAREPYPRMDPAFRRRLAARLTTPGTSARSRRWALAAAAGIVGGAALGVAGERVLDDRSGTPGGGHGGPLAPERAGATWVDTGVAAASLVEGTPVHVTAGGLPLFLVRHGQEVRAFSSICTHKPCQLLWDDKVDRFVCPWGRYQTFALDGSSGTPSLPSLPQAQIRVQDGRVHIYGIS